MARRINSTPKKDGFRMPGEFEEQEQIFMMWPERDDTWRNGGKPAQMAFAEVARAISEFEPVTMIVSKGQYENARNRLPEEIRVVEMSNDDAWAVSYTHLRKLIGQIDGVKVPFGATFKEFVVDFNGTGKTVAEINKALEAKKIFGGIDLSKDFPELGQSALFCVTEIHTLEDIDNLVQALKEVC